MQQIFKTIDALKEEFVSIWEDVCNIESPSNDKVGVDKVGEYFMRLAEKNGWNIEVFPHETFGNVVCVEMNPEAAGEYITLSGHMDTVYPVGLFGTPPAKREGDRLYGPGAEDCKGGLVAGFLAMQALKNCGFQERPVRMLLQSNEEIGSGLQNKEPIRYICEKAKGSKAFLNLEGHTLQQPNAVNLRRKGIAGFLCTVTGVAAHASKCAKEGASAILEAAYKIMEFEKIKNPEGITFNCGLIEGGSASNAVPAKCTFKLDVRFSTAAEYEEAKALVETIAGTVFVPGCRCEVTQTNLRPAMECNEAMQALFQKANELFVQNGLPVIEAGFGTGGSDASDVSAAGIPTLDSLGTVGDRIHSVEEYSLISSLTDSAKRLATLIVGL